MTSSETIREEAAKLVDDDLAHARHLRSLILEASGKLEANSLADAALVMRAAVAYSTALKNTSDVIHHTLRLDRLDDEAPSDLPVQIVRELTDAEVNDVRAQQRAEEEVFDEPAPSAATE